MTADEPSANEPAAAALARYYDLDAGPAQDDVGLYLAMARRTEAGGILELAVGTGRLAVPLALDGQDVTGVDRDSHMLDRARGAWRAAASNRRRRGALELVEADIVGLALGRRFELVILAFNSLLMLPGRNAQLAALRTIAAHLAPTGRAIVDVWLPAAEDLAIYDGRVLLDWIRDDPENGERVAKLSAARYDPATATAIVSTIFDAWPVATGTPRRVTREDELHFIAASELVALAAQAGLAVETLAGDYAMTEFGPGSERAVLVGSLL